MLKGRGPAKPNMAFVLLMIKRRRVGPALYFSFFNFEPCYAFA